MWQKDDVMLYRGDCLELLPAIPDGSVDVVMADPPYQTTACAWDTMIPLEPMWAQLKRVIKKNGAIVMTASQPFTTTLISSNMKMFKYCWVWDKGGAVGFLNARRMPMKNHEDVVVFCNGQTTYNPVGLRGACVLSNSGEGAEKTTAGGTYGKVRQEAYVSHESNFPNSIVNIRRVMNNTIHSTQKPVELMAYMIKTYTNEGDTVLDFCMGSGTTGVAAHRLKRKFIGMEMDADYFKTASERIKAEMAQGRMF